jgi:hypothetical protein
VSFKTKTKKAVDFGAIFMEHVHLAKVVRVPFSIYDSKIYNIETSQ